MKKIKKPEPFPLSLGVLSGSGLLFLGAVAFRKNRPVCSVLGGIGCVLLGAGSVLLYPEAMSRLRKMRSVVSYYENRKKPVETPRVSPAKIIPPLPSSLPDEGGENDYT